MTQIRLGPCLVLGGAGYFGRMLAKALVERGEEVTVFDVVHHDDIPSEARFVKGDIRDARKVFEAMDGCNTVFHAASKIQTLTLARMKQRRDVYDINVGGTRVVLDAARALGVTRLVYTSSMNVVPMPVAGADETAPYHDGPFADLYSRSKANAERLALAADGSEGLRTCAIRPGGIYGPGERQHLGRLVRELKGGKLVVRLGTGLADNIYIDDLVDAHIRAAERLEAGSRVCGQAYNINDGNPLNYFDFLRPAIEGLGYRVPRVRLPDAVLLGVAWASEVVHLLGGPVPFTTVMESHKLLRDNYLSNARAQEDLGWRPEVDYQEGMRRVMDHVRAMHAEAA